MKIKFYAVLATTLIFLFSFSQLSAQTSSVYVSAHPDDWQLFMNPNAYTSLKGTNEKVVFIHTTAGDGGDGTTSNYYLAREEGSLRAIRFMSNTYTNAGAPGAEMNPTTVTLNGHSIAKYTYRNAEIYFLRLPDGNYSGPGYAGTNNESLQKLYSGTITSISAIDGSTTYTSLEDLKLTLKAIVETETNGQVFFNLADHDAAINPDDHSDHVHSSLIMQDVARLIGDIDLNLYSEYNTASQPINISGDDLMINAGTWGATASGISDKHFFSTWDNDHNKWLYRQYFRTVPADTTPVVSVVATDSDAAENPLETGLYTVSLNSVNTGNPITITYTVSGTATPGADYIALSGSVTIPNGQQSETITVTPIDDTEVEPIETVILTLSSSTEYHLGSPATATVNITSDDLAPTGPNLALLKPTTAASGSSTSAKAVDGNYSQTNYWQGSPYPKWWQVDLGDQYDISSLAVITYYGNNRYYQYDIQASTDGNNWTTIIDFNTNTAPATSAGNTFNVNHHTARYLRVNMNYNSVNTGVHIIEFEAYGVLSGVQQPEVSIAATTPTATENPLENGVFTVSLDTINNSGPLTVYYTVGGTATPDADYIALPGSLIIPDGQQSATITVVPIDDTEVEPDETVILMLTSSTDYTVGAPSEATVTIISDDVAPPTENIALNKPTSSSSGAERSSAYAVDGNYDLDNWWGASPFPQWWRVDLGDAYDLSQLVMINYYDGYRYYQFDIEGSLDGVNWTTLVDFNTNTAVSTSQGNTFNLNHPSVRYIRVNLNYNSANIGVHIIEFEAYGTLTGASSRSASHPTDISDKNSSKTSIDYALSVFPNPNKSGNPIKLTLELPKSQRATVALFDVTGKLLANKTFDFKQGVNEVEMPTDYFSTGMLVVRIGIEGEVITKRVFIE